MATAAKTDKSAGKQSTIKPAATPKPAVAPRPAVAARSARPKKPAVAKREATLPALTPEQRRCYVEVAAYYIAERRGFGGDSRLDDWVQAEAEVDRLLREGILKP